MSESVSKYLTVLQSDPVVILSVYFNILGNKTNIFLN